VTIGVRLSRLGLFLGLILCFLSAPHLAATGKPNIVLVSLDTFRADRLAPWGGRADLAPNLNALCARGVAFTRCFTPAPITLPAHGTLLSGRYPAETGLHDNGLGRLTEGSFTLAQALSKRGYATRAVVSSAVLSSRYGLSRGFGEYDDGVGPSGTRGSSAVTDLAISMLSKVRGRPFFLWAHYFDTHAPYYSTEAFRTRASSPYDAAVATVDAEVGRLLRALPPNTIVAIVSDHGEGLGDHGEMTHGVLLFQSTVQVVCVLAGPGIAGGHLSDTPAGLADLAPTLYSLAGGSASPDGWVGHDLLAASPGAPPQRRVFQLEAWLSYDEFRWLPLTGVTDGRFKWVRGRWDRLYDLEDSPPESRDLASAPPPAASGLKALLPALAEPKESQTDLDPALRGLGYAPLPGPGSGFTALPDPESQLPILRGMLQGRLERSSGALDRSALTFGDLTSRDPGNPAAWLEYGQTLQLAGRSRDAERAALRALAIAPRSADAWATLGHARLAMDRPEEALKAYERAIELSPVSATALKALAEYELARGQLDRAAAHVRRVILSGFADASAFVLNGRICLAQARGKVAAESFEKAVEISPDPAQTLREEGDAYRLAGMSPQAENAYLRGVKGYPRFVSNYLALASLYMREDEPARALPMLKKALDCDLSPAERERLKAGIADLERALTAPAQK